MKDNKKYLGPRKKRSQRFVWPPPKKWPIQESGCSFCPFPSCASLLAIVRCRCTRQPRPLSFCQKNFCVNFVHLKQKLTVSGLVPSRWYSSSMGILWSSMSNSCFRSFKSSLPFFLGLAAPPSGFRRYCSPKKLCKLVLVQSQNQMNSTFKGQHTRCDAKNGKIIFFLKTETNVVQIP